MIGLVVLIGAAKVHAFIALILAGLGLGLGAGLPVTQTLSTFQKGFGETIGGVGVVLALGTMLGKLLTDSGGAERLVSALVDRAGARTLPWAMAAAAMIVGIPMFFEVGLVLLMPMIVLVSQRTGGSVLRVGLPALAALSILHGLVPPHPAPLLAAGVLGADLGTTMGLGLVVAIPTVALAGPVFGAWIAKRIDPTPAPLIGPGTAGAHPRCGPGPFAAGGAILLPVLLMLLRSAADLAGATGAASQVVRLAGHPMVALLVAVGAAVFILGYRPGGDLGRVPSLLGESLAPIAGIVMIIGAGGGFKETLIESGVGGALAKAAESASLSPLLLGWLVAVSIRVATGSATVATVGASGVLAPMVPSLGHTSRPLLALSIGAGSLFFSHVNDAGFWMVKEYFGMSIGETLRSWSTMETLLSVGALVLILALNLVH